MSNDWMPSTREGQLGLARLWDIEMTRNKTAWGIPEDYLSRHKGNTAASEAVYAEAQVEERTKSLTARLNTAFNAMDDHMRDGKKRYLYSPPLTEAQLIRMVGRIKDETPTHHGAPDAQVSIRAVPAGVHLFKVFFDKLPSEFHPAKGGDWGVALYEAVMPPGGATLEQAAGPKRYLREPPKDGTMMRYRKFTRRKDGFFDYPADESGNALYLCARYENGKGDAGPWGPVGGPFIIP